MRKTVREGVRLLRKRFEALKFTPEQRETILTLIANLVITDQDIQNGIDSRWKEQGVYPLNGDYLRCTGRGRAGVKWTDADKGMIVCD